MWNYHKIWRTLFSVFEQISETHEAPFLHRQSFCTADPSVHKKSHHFVSIQCLLPQHSDIIQCWCRNIPGCWHCTNTWIQRCECYALSRARPGPVKWIHTKISEAFLNSSFLIKIGAHKRAPSLFCSKHVGKGLFSHIEFHWDLISFRCGWKPQRIIFKTTDTIRLGLKTQSM